MKKFPQLVLIYSNICVCCFHNITMVKEKYKYKIKLPKKERERKKKVSDVFQLERSAVHDEKNKLLQKCPKSKPRRPAINIHVLHHHRFINTAVHRPSHSCHSYSWFVSIWKHILLLLLLLPTQTVSASIRPGAWGCSPAPSVLSRPGPSPSWSECVSSAWPPWFSGIPPWPRCQTPGPSAWAPACASPPSPTCEGRQTHNERGVVGGRGSACNRGRRPHDVLVSPHRSSSCFRDLLWPLRALSSACLFCSSARISSSESPPGPGRSSESSSPWATSSSLIRASRERVWGTLGRGGGGGGGRRYETWGRAK